MIERMDINFYGFLINWKFNLNLKQVFSALPKIHLYPEVFLDFDF